jgi:hypothetical protein
VAEAVPVRATAVAASVVLGAARAPVVAVVVLGAGVRVTIDSGVADRAADCAGVAAAVGVVEGAAASSLSPGASARNGRVSDVETATLFSTFQQSPW